QLHGRQHRRHRQHQRPRLSAAGLGDGRSQNPSTVLRQLASLRPLRGSVGSTGWRELVLHERARPAPQRRMDVRQPLTRGIHRLSVPSRRQGNSVPHQPGDELLIEVMNVTRRSWYRSAALLAALISLALLVAFWARPIGAPGQAAATEFNDSHFHLTNYIQQGVDVKQFLRIMGTRVPRSTLFGIPLQQQWSYANSGDFAPTYYLHSDAPLYYYSFTDAYIASLFKALTPAEQQRFDPMITGFNPADMYGVDHIRRV